MCFSKHSMTGKILRYSIRIVLGILLLLLLLSIGAYLYFNSKAGKSYLSKLVISTASETLGTPVSGNISFKFPDWVKVENLYIADSKKDSLLAAKSLYLDIDMWALKDNKLLIQKAELFDSKLFIKKKEGKFNFDEIFEKLTKPSKKPSIAAPWSLKLTGFFLKNLNLSFQDTDNEHDVKIQIANLESGFEELKPNINRYFLKNTTLNGLKINGEIGKIRNSAKSDTQANIYDLALSKLSITNIESKLLFKKLKKQIEIKNADLQTEIKKLNLDSLTLKSLSFSAEKLAYNTTVNAKKRSDEFDADHITLEKVDLKTENTNYNSSSISTENTLFYFNENSGIKNKTMLSHLDFRNNVLNISDLESSMNQSILKGNILTKLNPKNPEKLSYTAHIQNAILFPADGLLFNRQLLKNESYRKIVKDNFKIKGVFSGDLNTLNFKQTQILAPKNTYLATNGTIKNLQKNQSFEVNIENLNTLKSDISPWINLSAYTIPEKINAKGKISGNSTQIVTDLQITSTQGLANVRANIRIPDEKFEVDLVLRDYKVGELIKNQDIGTVTGKSKFSGYSFKSPVITSNSHLDNVVFQNKTYSNIDLAANIKNKLVDIDLHIKQTDADITWKGTVDLNADQIKIAGKTNIESLNLKSLGITEQNVEIKGNFDIKQLEWNPASPLINLNGNSLQIFVDNKMYPIESLSIRTETEKDAKKIHIVTPFLDLNLKGAFSYNSLLQALQQEVHRYFKIPGFNPAYTSEATDVKIDAKIIYDPIFTAFVPALKGFEPIEIQTFVKTNSAMPLGGIISIPYLKLDSLNIRNTSLDFVGNQDEITYTLLTQEVQNQSYRIRNASIEGKIKDNLADFSLSVKDEKQVKIHALKGYLQSITDGVKLSFDESGTLLSYQAWAGNPYGSFEYTTAGVKFNDVVFTNGEQIVRVNSLNEVPNGPLAVFAQNIDLKELSKSFLRDSVLVAGKMNIDLEVLNYMTKEPSFTGDFSIDNLIYKKYLLGKLQGKAETEGADKIGITADLLGEKQNLNLSGTYAPKAKESLDFVANIRSFDAKTLGIWTENVLQDLDGTISGLFTVKGTSNKPNIEGSAMVDLMKMRLKETGALLTIENQTMTFKDDKIKLTNVLINDAEGKTMTLNGQIDMPKLPDYSYNIIAKSTDFKIIDAKEGQNTLYLGQGYVDTDLHIIGKNLDFKVTGDIALKNKTNLTLLTDQESQALTEMNQIVTFVQKVDSTLNSEIVAEESKINFANSVNVNLDIRKEAKIKLLMDAVTGDIMEVNGTGKLNVGFDNQGDVFVIGTFDIENGKYDLTYQVIKKEFIIDKTSKSKITWNGDPMKGNIAITAYNVVPGKKSIAIKDKKVSIPVRVDLMITQEILQPNINFEVVVKETDIGSLKDDFEKEGYKIINKNNIKDAGTTLAADKKEQMSNKAILLLLGGNIDAEAIGSGQGNPLDFENVARQKASEIITSQINNYAAGIIKGLDIDLGIDSKRNGELGSNTNVKLGISKKIANERLILSVGKNFEVENSAYKSDQIFDNLQADWLVTKDGRYRFNAFRKNLTNLVLEGTVVETGLGFVVSIDYDTWKELVKRSKKTK
jgi:translocation and assembly module TamB